jgi:hypothetical protein
MSSPTINLLFQYLRGVSTNPVWSKQDYQTPRITLWPTATFKGVLQAPDRDDFPAKTLNKSDMLTVADFRLTSNTSFGALEDDRRHTISIPNTSNYRASFARLKNPSQNSFVGNGGYDSFSTSNSPRKDHQHHAHGHAHHESRLNLVKANNSSVVRSRSSKGIEPRAIISRGWAKSLWDFSGRDGIVDYHINFKGRGRASLKMSSKEVGFIRDTFRLLDNLTGLSFVERKSLKAADIRIYCAAKIGGGSEGAAFRGNGWFDVVWKDKKGPKLTTFEKHLIRHEIAHTLGLDHPYGRGSHPRYDTKDTVMSYNWRGNYNYTFSDVRALQQLWGSGVG